MFSMIIFQCLGRTLNEAPFAGTNINDNLIFNYGCINNFAQFWFYPFDTFFMSIGTKFSHGVRCGICTCFKGFCSSFPTLASLEIVNALLVLHLLNIDFPYSDSLLNFQPDSQLELFVDFLGQIFCAFFIY